MEASKSIKPELFEKWKNELNSDSLFAVAEASVYLGESGDPQAIEPLLKLAETTNDWLVQDLAVSGLTQLAGMLPEAITVLKQVERIQPPATDHVLEIKPTAGTPYVSFDFEKGKFFLRGKGTGEDEMVRATFKLITDEFEAFDRMYPGKPLIASFCIKSMFVLFSNELFRFFRRISHHKNTIVYWHYEIFGDSMTYVGEDYESVVDLKFIYLEVPQSGPYYDY